MYIIMKYMLSSSSFGLGIYMSYGFLDGVVSTTPRFVFGVWFAGLVAASTSLPRRNLSVER